MTQRRAASHLLAFLPQLDPQALAETLVAFANSDGGTIVLGYDERGRPSGATTPEDIEAVLREAAGLTSPPVRATLENAGGDGNPQLIVRVPRSVDLHSLKDGRVFVRVAGENRALTGDEIRNLTQSKLAGDYEAETVPGATLADFDDEIVAEYIAKRELRTRRKMELAERDAQHAASLLKDIGALDARGQPTVAGILLFGKNPQAFLPQSGVVFVKFPGVEPRGEGGRVGYGRREEINGPLARVIERTWQVILEEMRVGAIVKGLEREEVLEYPEFAVREALVNAVCHRDYRLRGRRIEVRKYADRLEIISPGGLAGYITLDNIIEEHFSRNPRLVQGLFQWGYIEELGLGIDRMIEDMVAAGHPAPKFNATAYSFTVTLSNVRERRATHNITLLPTAAADGAALPPGLTVNERQARALQYVREHGRITNRDFQVLCPNVTPETLRIDLADLVDKGVLMRVGEKKGTYYILK
ncbi:MAG: transcriptional regulator [Chloroflexi bacterium]|jgi:ATP-dependent DNA helicase RecG|uniref:Transcriptional regulator n=1 Tax=Candidatus Thermofonsia Clade 3 bacterium TaxID=2364212 RepID=A0A2M8QCB5_9CHLR|nr:ATP-binding protein [Candidatus Roseilinea sp. NK_OTU-006]PJF47420.1 MAG: transcriptional regulator [Candidatus Thermofonsia Clade 3 bacterium]RMG64156.1 MAG: transcriptional regulator [Chloroflexota bacterium]